MLSSFGGMRWPKAPHRRKERSHSSALSALLRPIDCSVGVRGRVRWRRLESRNPGMPNQALEQTRDSVLRYGAVVGCELLNFFVLP